MPGTKEGARKALAAKAAKDAADARLQQRFGLQHRQKEKPTHYVVGLRPLKVDGLEYLPGEVVPGAEAWPRVEAWVRARSLVPAYAPLMTTAAEPVEAGEPEELPEVPATAPEDDDPLEFTGEPLEDEEVTG